MNYLIIILIIIGIANCIVANTMGRDYLALIPWLIGQVSLISAIILFIIKLLFKYKSKSSKSYDQSSGKNLIKNRPPKSKTRLLVECSFIIMLSILILDYYALSKIKESSAAINLLINLMVKFSLITAVAYLIFKKYNWARTGMIVFNLYIMIHLLFYTSLYILPNQRTGVLLTLCILNFYSLKTLISNDILKK